MGEQLIPENIELLFNNILYNIVYGFNKSKTEVAPDDRKVCMNSYYANIAIMFFYFILNDKRPPDVCWLKVEKNSLECPLLYIPVFKYDNGDDYYNPVETTIDEKELLEEFKRLRVNDKINSSNFIQVIDNSFFYGYPYRQQSDGWQDSNSLLNSLLKNLKASNNCYTNEAKRATLFLKYALGVITYEHLGEDLKDTISFQIKLLYAFMFTFFFDTIWESDLGNNPDIIKCILQTFIPGVDRILNYDGPYEKSALMIINNVISSTQDESFKLLRHFSNYLEGKNTSPKFDVSKILEKTNFNELFVKRLYMSHKAFVSFAQKNCYEINEHKNKKKFSIFKSFIEKFSRN